MKLLIITCIRCMSAKYARAQSIDAKNNMPSYLQNKHTHMYILILYTLHTCFTLLLHSCSVIIIVIMKNCINNL